MKLVKIESQKEKKWENDNFNTFDGKVSETAGWERDSLTLSVG